MRPAVLDDIVLRRRIALLGLAALYACVAGPGSARQNDSRRTNERDGAVMVSVPAGEFIMGSSDADIAAIARADPRSQIEFLANERPRRTVALGRYWIYRHEVTVGQFRRFCAATGRTMPSPPEWGWKDDHPIVNVTWNDAQTYAQWAGAALPTEQEWEKAARGSDGRLFPWGNTWPPPQGVGNFSDASAKRKYRSWLVIESYDDGYAEVAPVGSFPKGASPCGALDMAGNVWEWCADSADPRNRSATARGQTAGAQATFRAVRGGSWSNYGADFLHSARRHRKEAAQSDHNLGFRCVVREGSGDR